MSLTPICDDVWQHAMGLRIGLVELPRRMTVVRLNDGGLWLHNVGDLSDADFAALDALGPVAHVVAPNCFHHFYVERFVARYPQARLWAAPGLGEKRSDLPFHATLGEAPPAEWGDAFDQARLEGSPRFNEVVFFHRASRTAIVTDLLFHVGPEATLGTRCLMRLNGAYGRLSTTRLFRLASGDRAGIWRLGQAILGWNPARVTVAHGEVCEDPAPQLEAAFERFRPR